MTDTDLLRRILGAMHVGPPGPADIAWLAEKGLHVLDAIEDQAAATERARIAELVAPLAAHRRCGPKYEGCYSHLPMAHCRACGMAVPCDVMQFLAAIEGEPK